MIDKDSMDAITQRLMSFSVELASWYLYSLRGCVFVCVCAGNTVPEAASSEMPKVRLGTSAASHMGLLFICVLIPGLNLTPTLMCGGAEGGLLGSPSAALSLWPTYPTHTHVDRGQ